MKIDSASSNNVSSFKSTNKSAQSPKQKGETTIIDSKDELILSPKKEKKATYDKPNVDTNTIKKLQQESKQAYNQLREIVKKLLQRQGLTFKDVFDGAEVSVDDTARLEAADLIAEGGPLSPEAVSDRIVEFAKAISGGDKEKLGLLRSAIEKGFQEAKTILGGSLPEISAQTYKLVMEKLDAWENE